MKNSIISQFKKYIKENVSNIQKDILIKLYDEFELLYYGEKTWSTFSPKTSAETGSIKDDVVSVEYINDEHIQVEVYLNPNVWNFYQKLLQLVNNLKGGAPGFDFVKKVNVTRKKNWARKIYWIIDIHIENWLNRSSRIGLWDFKKENYSSEFISHEIDNIINNKLSNLGFYYEINYSNLDDDFIRLCVYMPPLDELLLYGTEEEYCDLNLKELNHIMDDIKTQLLKLSNIENVNLMKVEQSESDGTKSYVFSINITNDAKRFNKSGLWDFQNENKEYDIAYRIANKQITVDELNKLGFTYYKTLYAIFASYFATQNYDILTYYFDQGFFHFIKTMIDANPSFLSSYDVYDNVNFLLNYEPTIYDLLKKKLPQLMSEPEFKDYTRSKNTGLWDMKKESMSEDSKDLLDYIIQQCIMKDAIFKEYRYSGIGDYLFSYYVSWADDNYYWPENGGIIVYKNKVNIFQSKYNSDKELYDKIERMYKYKFDSDWQEYIETKDDEDKIKILKYLQKFDLLSTPLEVEYQHLLRSSNSGLWDFQKESIDYELWNNLYDKILNKEITADELNKLGFAYYERLYKCFAQLFKEQNYDLLKYYFDDGFFHFIKTMIDADPSFLIVDNVKFLLEYDPTIYDLLKKKIPQTLEMFPEFKEYVRSNKAGLWDMKTESIDDKKFIVDNDIFKLYVNDDLVAESYFTIEDADEWFDEKYVTLYDIKTYEQYLRKGYAKYLLEQIFNYVENLNINIITLIVYKDNIGAEMLYRKLGFENFIEYEDSYSLVKRFSNIQNESVNTEKDIKDIIGNILRPIMKKYKISGDKWKWYDQQLNGDTYSFIYHLYSTPMRTEEFIDNLMKEIKDKILEHPAVERFTNTYLNMCYKYRFNVKFIDGYIRSKKTGIWDLKTESSNYEDRYGFAEEIEAGVLALKRIIKKRNTECLTNWCKGKQDEDLDYYPAEQSVSVLYGVLEITAIELFKEGDMESIEYLGSIGGKCNPLNKRLKFAMDEYLEYVTKGKYSDIFYKIDKNKKRSEIIEFPDNLFEYALEYEPSNINWIVDYMTPRQQERFKNEYRTLKSGLWDMKTESVEEEISDMIKDEIISCLRNFNTNHYYPSGAISYFEYKYDNVVKLAIYPHLFTEPTAQYTEEYFNNYVKLVKDEFKKYSENSNILKDNQYEISSIVNRLANGVGGEIIIKFNANWLNRGNKSGLWDMKMEAQTAKEFSDKKLLKLIQKTSYWPKCWIYYEILRRKLPEVKELFNPFYYYQFNPAITTMNRGIDTFNYRNELRIAIKENMIDENFDAIGYLFDLYDNDDMFVSMYVNFLMEDAKWWGEGNEEYELEHCDKTLPDSFVEFLLDRNPNYINDIIYIEVGQYVYEDEGIIKMMSDEMKKKYAYLLRADKAGLMDFKTFVKEQYDFDIICNSINNDSPEIIVDTILKCIIDNKWYLRKRGKQYEDQITNINPLMDAGSNFMKEFAIDKLSSNATSIPTYKLDIRNMTFYYPEDIKKKQYDKLTIVCDLLLNFAAPVNINSRITNTKSWIDYFNKIDDAEKYKLIEYFKDNEYKFKFVLDDIPDWYKRSSKGGLWDLKTEKLDIKDFKQECKDRKIYPSNASKNWFVGKVLTDCVKDGDIEGIQWLLNNKYITNDYIKNYDTEGEGNLFQVAVQHSHLDVLDYLLNICDLDINDADIVCNDILEDPTTTFYFNWKNFRKLIDKGYIFDYDELEHRLHYMYGTKDYNGLAEPFFNWLFKKHPDYMKLFTDVTLPPKIEKEFGHLKRGLNSGLWDTKIKN